MKRIVVESDHFLKIIPVILDPRRAKNTHAPRRFYAHDRRISRLVRTLPRRNFRIVSARVVLRRGSVGLRREARDAECCGRREFSHHRARARPVRSICGPSSVFGAAPTESISRLQGARHRRPDAPAVGNVAVAEQVFALLIALSKRLVGSMRVVTAEPLQQAG